MTMTSRHSTEWIKYLAVALICALVAIDGIGSVMAKQPEQTGCKWKIAPPTYQGWL